MKLKIGDRVKLLGVNSNVTSYLNNIHINTGNSFFVNCIKRVHEFNQDGIIILDKKYNKRFFFKCEYEKVGIEIL